VCEGASARVYDAADASFGQTWPFALVELPASFALTTAADHHLFTDGASYEIPNFPVLKLARWLAARSKARTSISQRPRHNFQIFFFKKSGIGADAIRAAGSKRR